VDGGVMRFMILPMISFSEREAMNRILIYRFALGKSIQSLNSPQKGTE
jgi:hypothetical protein